ncbi:hypothetical protein [Streptomyces sp. V1I6]|uniref:hypothetical protein n=1 Tax=Streptomyces sp. V1I6 TaxID=3042273 RepID=UPI00277F9413|nr:hypothetical protein [Streptomyces sp. V1I6]MDQ0840488.1 hypothetical protein [Streptomyces sp. V1I6]
MYQVRARLVDRLDARGLRFNEEKSTVVRLDKGSATATAAPSSSSHAWTGIVRHQLVTGGRLRTTPR